MKEKDILVSLDMAKDEYIEEASPENEKVKRKIRNRFEWIQLALPVAACLCIACVGAIILKSGGNQPVTSSIDDTVTSYDGTYGDVPVIEYTAQQIGDVINDDTLSGEAPYYENYTYLSDNYLKQQIKDNVSPEQNYLPIYEMVSPDWEKGDRGEVVFEKYEGVIDRFYEQVQSKYNKNEIDYSDNGLYLFRTGGFNFEIFTTDIYDWVSIDNSEHGRVEYKPGELHRSFKNGELSINWNRPDEELIKDVEWIKKELFDIFDRDFSDVEIGRDSDPFGDDIYFIFYNEAEAYNGIDRKKDDYIRLKFHSDEASKDGSMYMASIDYYVYHKEPEELQKITGVAERITLSEAEELLSKGYVFCYHACEKCFEEGKKLRFDDYDFVEINYIDIDFNTWEIEGYYRLPFYTFYKKDSDLEDGKVKYSVTNVCAIKLTGYEEYFASREKYHS
ncbi:MAG: hypothetical protein IJF09_03365 [Ruminiclostridium sp.]|nr:hypothetical protein [Ruminiclostridium sp.]